MNKLVFSVLGLALVSSSGCGAGHVTTGGPPTASQATGRQSVVAVTGPTSPFVVDWLGEQRGDLEEAMHDGVAVVAFDPQGLRLVKSCHVDGQYGYLGLITKYQMVRFESAQEVSANLPLGGAALLGQIGGDFSQGTTLDLAMAIVGKKRTTWRHVTRADLLGDCEGATHFVRGVTVGAFVLAPGERSESHAAAEVLSFGAKYHAQAGKQTTNSDGELDACKQAAPDSASPPAQCAALLRIELEPIRSVEKAVLAVNAEVGQQQAQTTRPTECPAGMVYTGDKCVLGSSATSHACAGDDDAECAEQCQLGNAISCDNHGVLLVQHGANEAGLMQAAEAFKHGCDLGLPNACLNLGLVSMDSNPTQASALFLAACNNASALGCRALGDMLYLGRGVPGDKVAALKHYKMACDGGDYGGCTMVGFLYAGGADEIPKDERRGIDYTGRACDGGESVACGNLGLKYEFGVVVPKNPKLAVTLFDRACRMNDADCLRLGIAYQAGFGVPRDDSRARELYARSCAAASRPGSAVGFGALSCTLLDLVYKAPQAEPSQNQQALQEILPVMAPQCAQDVPRACTFAGIAQIGLGHGASGWTSLETGCAMHDYWACDLKKRLGSK